MSVSDTKEAFNPLQSGHVVSEPTKVVFKENRLSTMHKATVNTDRGHTVFTIRCPDWNMRGVCKLLDGFGNCVARFQNSLKARSQGYIGTKGNPKILTLRAVQGGKSSPPEKYEVTKEAATGHVVLYLADRPVGQVLFDSEAQVFSVTIGGAHAASIGCRASDIKGLLFGAERLEVMVEAGHDLAMMALIAVALDDFYS